MRVLIVDDEAPLARALAEEIGNVHDVKVVLSAEAALRALRSTHFDVVLCDLRMPGMSGESLYAKVAAEDMASANGFIFMTGMGFGADVEKFLRESGRPVLEKPFSGATAKEAINKVAKARAKRHSR